MTGAKAILVLFILTMVLGNLGSPWLLATLGLMLQKVHFGLAVFLIVLGLIGIFPSPLIPQSARVTFLLIHWAQDRSFTERINCARHISLRSLANATLIPESQRIAHTAKLLGVSTSPVGWSPRSMPSPVMACHRTIKVATGISIVR